MGLRSKPRPRPATPSSSRHLTADSADIGIGSGPGMAFMAKGVPAKAVAVMYGVPKNMAVMVGYNSPIKTVDDLKGKKLGCTTVGSLTDWIGDRITHLKGWGAAGITMVPIGGMPPARAAMKTGQLDGYIGALESGYALEERRNGASSPAPRPLSTISSPTCFSCARS